MWFGVGWVEVLQVRVQPGAPPLPPLSLCLDAVWRATQIQLHICMCKKARRRLTPPSTCVVDAPAICLSASESSSPHRHSLSSSDLTSCLFSTCNTSLFFFPGSWVISRRHLCDLRDIFRTLHSCLSRFLPSMFVFLFPYSHSIWMELN